MAAYGRKREVDAVWKAGAVDDDAAALFDKLKVAVKEAPEHFLLAQFPEQGAHPLAVGPGPGPQQPGGAAGEPLLAQAVACFLKDVVAHEGGQQVRVFALGPPCGLCNPGLLHEGAHRPGVAEIEDEFLLLPAPVRHPELPYGLGIAGRHRLCGVGLRIIGIQPELFVPVDPFLLVHSPSQALGVFSDFSGFIAK